MTRLLHHYVMSQAQARPDAIAVAMGERQLTYGQLESRSNQLARLLRDRGVQRGDRVCVLMPKSLESILSFHGILKADAIYVPVDPASPAARVQKIIRSCEATLILAAEGVDALLDEVLAAEAVGSLCVGWMGSEPSRGRTFRPAFTVEHLSAYPPTAPETKNAESDPAHILFTSGSTGAPKGVIITHSNVVHFVEWAVRYFGIGPSDRTSCHSPFHFDLSTFDMYGTFAAGARLHLVPPELNIAPQKLAEWIRANELTQWFSAPSALNLMARFDVVRQNDFPTLKRLMWCGEVFPTPSLIYWMKRLPHVTFTNLYGPTEATIASSYYTVPQCPTDDKAAIPIGRGCEGEALLVLDEHLRPVPPGEIGNLYIQGVGLSPGYWRDPEKTAAAFVGLPQDPTARIYRTGDLAKIGPDGLVYFLGRTDSLIKCRGHRIELGEIETAANAIGDLAECAIVAIDSDGFEGKVICCAYVPAEGAKVSPASLRQSLLRAVPAYMIPSRWLAFDRLPKNANGKIDRPRLREQFARQN